MTGNKTNESSEAYLDELLSQMLSSRDRNQEAEADPKKMRPISENAKEPKVPEDRNDLEIMTAGRTEDIEQSNSNQEIAGDRKESVPLAEVFEETEEPPAEPDTEEYIEDGQEEGKEISVQEESAAVFLEASVEEDTEEEIEIPVSDESEAGYLGVAEKEMLGEEAEIPVPEEDAAGYLEASEKEMLEEVEIPVQEEDMGIQDTEETAWDREPAPILMEELGDLGENFPDIPEEPDGHFEEPILAAGLDDETDIWDGMDEDGYEEYEEWEDDTDMKEDFNFDLPEASELDILEESDISEEFHMEEQNILDEIEQELSGILPKRKEMRERRKKKEVPAQGEADSFMEETKMDGLFSEEENAAVLEMDGNQAEIQVPVMDGIQTEENLVSEMNEVPPEEAALELDEAERPSGLEPEELDISDMNLFDEGTDSLEEVSEDLDALFSEDNQEMKEDEKKAMDENDGFDLDSLFAASDDGFGEGLSEGGNETPDGDMDDLFGMLDMADGESTQEAAPDLFAKEEGNENDIFALDNGDADEDIFALDGMEEPEAKEEEKLPDPDNVFGESLAAVGFEEGAGEAAQEKEGEKGGKKKKKAKKEKDGTSLFTKLFGNIIDKKSKQQFETEQKAEADAEFKRSEKQRIKEGRLTEEEKAAEAAKEAEEARLKEEKAAAKEAKKKAAEEKKAEKEAKKKAKREALEAEAAKEVDEGRINRVGAGIVFAFFGAVAAGVVVGTNLYTYSQSISRATEYFDVQKYNNAYKEVYGLDIKEKDETIYNKIMTVMFVNKELNSYNNFYAIGLYPEALDSLLKGLERYDKYLQNAESLGIESDLNYVRRQILGELKRSFSMTEKDAAELNAIKEQEEYSERIRKKAFAGNE